MKFFTLPHVVPSWFDSSYTSKLVLNITPPIFQKFKNLFPGFLVLFGGFLFSTISDTQVLQALQTTWGDLEAFHPRYTHHFFLGGMFGLGVPIPKWNENSKLVANWSSPKKRVCWPVIQHQWCFARHLENKRCEQLIVTYSPRVHPCPTSNSRWLGARQGQLSLLSKRLTMLREEHEAEKKPGGVGGDAQRSWGWFLFPYYPPGKWHIPSPGMFEDDLSFFQDGICQFPGG